MEVKFSRVFTFIKNIINFYNLFLNTLSNNCSLIRFNQGQLSIISHFEVYVSKMTLEKESHKNDIH